MTLQQRPGYDEVASAVTSLEEECCSPRLRPAGPVTATQRRLVLLRQRVTAVGFEVRQVSRLRQGHRGPRRT